MMCLLGVERQTGGSGGLVVRCIRRTKCTKLVLFSAVAIHVGWANTSGSTPATVRSSEKAICWVGTTQNKSMIDTVLRIALCRLQ